MFLLETVSNEIPDAQDIVKNVEPVVDNVTNFFETYWFAGIKAVVTLIVGYFIAKLVYSIIHKSLTKIGVDKSLTKFLGKTAKIIIYLVAVISAIGILGIPTTGIIAAMSAVAVAISLALKDSLSNISGGIFLLITRPFKTNDVVETGGYIGTIKEIQLIHTVILTFDYREVIIPNGIMVNSTVVNMSNEEKRRVDLTFSISYDNDPEVAKNIILKTAISHPKVIREPDEPFARVSAHAGSSVDISARIWCLAGDYWNVYFDMLEQVRREFDKNGISIPYDQLDVHVDSAKQ